MNDDRDTLRDIVLRLEGTVNAGFAGVRGEMRLLQRGETDTVRRVGELEEDVDELKGRRFPLPVTGGIMGVLAVCMSAFTLVRGG